MIPNHVIEAYGQACDGVVTFDSTYVISVHEAELPHHVRLIQKEDTTSRLTKQCYELQIRDTQNNAPVRVIEAEARSSFQFMMPEEYPGIEYVDINFDMYLDIKMYNSRSPNGANAGYDIYLFNPDERTFVRSEEFSKIIYGAWVELRDTHKEITSYSSIGCFHNCWIETTYRVNNGVPSVYKRKSQMDTEDCASGFTLIEEEIVDGELKMVNEECT